jgi:hypothetical protein
MDTASFCTCAVQQCRASLSKHECPSPIRVFCRLKAHSALSHYTHNATEYRQAYPAVANFHILLKVVVCCLAMLPSLSPTIAVGCGLFWHRLAGVQLQ